jgi:hypothetical protein
MSERLHAKPRGARCGRGPEHALESWAGACFRQGSSSLRSRSRRCCGSSGASARCLNSATLAWTGERRSVGLGRSGAGAVSRCMERCASLLFFRVAVALASPLDRLYGWVPERPSASVARRRAVARALCTAALRCTLRKRAARCLERLHPTATHDSSTDGGADRMPGARLLLVPSTSEQCPEAGARKEAEVEAARDLVLRRLRARV